MSLRIAPIGLVILVTLSLWFISARIGYIRPVESGSLEAGLSAAGATIQDFDVGGTTFSSGQCTVAPPPTVTPGGPTGNFLRLATTTVPNHNTIAFDRTATGPCDMVVADFDFRIKTNPPGRADGLAFALLNTANYGSNGAVCPPDIAEEPNYTGSLGVGFDIYKSGPPINDIGDDNVRLNFSNSLSIHFNGIVLTQADVTPVVDFGGGHWIHARIIMRPGGGLSDMSVILTPYQGKPVTVVDRFKITGLAPYEGRAHFGARSGGESSNFDLDNVQVQFMALSQSLLSVESISYTTDEDGPSAVITVTRSGDNTGTATVQCSTADITAQAGADYTAVSKTLSFGACENRKSFSVPILNDATNEGEESFKVFLSNPTGGDLLGGPSAATVTIFDDERSRTAGRWSNINWLPVLPIHAHLLHTGKVMFWDRFGVCRLLDTATQALSTPQQPGYDIFCAGHSFMADGKLLVTGGHHMGGGPIHDGVGIATASLYDPVSNTWTALPDMNAGRWYPTNTTLASGDVLVLSGSVDMIFTKNPLAQIWQPATGAWRSLTGAQQLEPLGVDLYPRMFLAPDGRVFKASPDRDSWFLNTSGAGSWSQGPLSNFAPPRTYGSAAMYGAGKILICGGGDPPTATAEVIDLNAGAPAWRSVASMAFARRHLNATALPDGSVLVTGGSSGAGFSDEATPALAAELWNPATETWSTLSSMQSPRLYHSLALLLPDGRVLSGGGGEGGGVATLQNNAEIYSPPYLFKGPRPAIAAVPSSLAYGQPFFINTPDASAITKVSLIRLPSVTHAFDQNQQFLSLAFSQVMGGLSVTAPSSANLCAPGHYMLFIINESGVPSVARIIQVGQAGCSFSILPLSQSFGTGGGTASASLLAPSACGWTVTSDSNWINVTSSASGSGSSTITYSVAANDTASSRSGAINIAGQILTINQSADTDGDSIADVIEPAEGTSPLIKDNDVFTKDRLFVMQQYRDFFSREAEPDGISYWTGVMSQGVTRAQVIDNFFNSAEFQGSIAPVVRLYFAYFLRIPDYEGLLFWVNHFRHGVPLETISEMFAQSREFQLRYGSLNNSDFVALVYNNVLGRSPDAEGCDFWKTHLDNGTLTRGQMMMQFSESSEYGSKIFNEVYVTMIYIGMLRRSPDPGGFDFWLAALDGGQPGLSLIQGFLNATEYRNRFLPPQ